MQVPLRITFRGMASSPAVEDAIRERVMHLEHFHDRITRCHVTLDVPHRHRSKGRLFAVRLDITTPDREIAVTRDPPLDHTHEDFNVVLRDAFDAAVRQLEADVRRRRG